MFCLQIDRLFVQKRPHQLKIVARSRLQVPKPVILLQRVIRDMKELPVARPENQLVMQIADGPQIPPVVFRIDDIVCCGVFKDQ